ncbi:phage tail length tape measure family protein [Phaeobacter sp. B1627]|uniref:phage tail length tape measure family protein n=1 Tax=Phaeobacter sp. B1627 TaxID=2583809 RepID=UPI0011186093|nr:phage tail length tape measure family protein [Phaeobacter sp. B1627]TNJ40497.1 hypothetical protein FGE21_17940 [Phaeobacter sp. B1627]
MTFVVQGEILMDGSDAKSELQRLRSENAKLVTSTEKVNQSTTRWGRAMSGARSRVSALRSNTASWIAGLRNVDQSQALAAGSAANLTAQFNDIGVMMAAGQDPMQLAIQQGTQITQVFGNRGAAAALGATRQAVLNMVSPLNLITIGSIAAGAALVNWLSSAGEEAESFEDRLKAMSDAVDAFGDRQKDAFQSSADMIRKFGSASPELRAVLRDLALMSKLEAKEELDEISQSVRDLVLDLSFLDDRTSRSAAQDFLGLSSISSKARELGALFANNLEILSKSEDPATKLRAALDVRDMLLEARGGVGKLNEQQKEFYQGLAALIQQLEVFGARIRQPWEDLRETGGDLWSSLVANAQVYLGKRLQIEATARSTIRQLRLEAEINEAIRASGEGSVEVAELRLRAERELTQERVNELKITDDLKAEMMASWDAANGVASVDIAGNLSLAADQAQRLKEQLHAARGAAIMARVRDNPGFGDPRGESPGAGNPDYIYRDQGLPPVPIPPNPRKSRSGGGAAATNRERQAIEELLRREAERLEILRETDPVLQEMIRHRDAMKSATDAEREALEKIIRERVEEQQAIEATQQAGAFLGDTMGDVLTALQAQGDDAAAAWDRVKASIAAAVLEAALLGDGSLAGVFGTADGGGLLGSLFGVQKKAGGGIITGQGGDRSDKEVVLVSPGEFFVNAKATRKHRHLLEAINAGALLPGMAPAFANGGAFAAPPLPSPPGGPLGAGTGGGVSRVLIQPSPLFKAVVEQQSRETAVEVTETYDREHSRSSFDRNVNDPWSVG